METPVPKYKRLYPDGPECRLKGAYLIRCTGCRKDEKATSSRSLRSTTRRAGAATLPTAGR